MERITQILRVSVLVILALLFFDTLPLRATQLQVTVTFSILADFVNQVGGDRVQVNSLVPLGADPHTWEPSPREARQVAQADLLVANGGGFDHWLVNLQKNAARPGVPLIYAAQGLFGSNEKHPNHGFGEDPHYWLSVTNAMHYVQQITEGLIALEPEEATFFSHRAQEYIQRLGELDARILAIVEQIPPENRVIVAYHNAFSHFARRYGFNVAQFLVENPEAEPSPRDLGKALEVLAKLARPVVFTEPQLKISERYAQLLADEIGGEVYVLYSDSLDQNRTTYIEMMDYNAKTLLEALR